MKTHIEKKPVGLIAVIPNCITSFRIAGTAALLFLEPFTPAFYVLYGLCGFSDVLDGYVARKTGTVSSLGSRLDSAADLLFYALMLLRIFPVLWAKLPQWIWHMVGTSLLMRAVSYGTVALRYRRFAAIHSYMNKVTGLMVFLVPYVIESPWPVESCAAVCTAAVLSSAEEMLIHLCTSSYQEGVKSIFQIKR